MGKHLVAQERFKGFIEFWNNKHASGEHFCIMELEHMKPRIVTETMSREIMYGMPNGMFKKYKSGRNTMLIPKNQINLSIVEQAYNKGHYRLINKSEKIPSDPPQPSNKELMEIMQKILAIVETFK